MAASVELMMSKRGGCVLNQTQSEVSWLTRAVRREREPRSAKEPTGNHEKGGRLAVSQGGLCGVPQTCENAQLQKKQRYHSTFTAVPNGRARQLDGSPKDEHSSASGRLAEDR